MLGGSFWVAFLRNAIGAVLMMAVFLLLDRPRLSMKKTVLGYVMAGAFLSAVFSVWYLWNTESYIQFSGLFALLSVGIFCGLMSSEVIYLTLYKIIFAFYLLALIVFCGVDIARWWFGGNLWVDILIRFVMVMAILCFIIKKFRSFFLDNVDFLREEMDSSSAFVLVGSVLLAASVAYWPSLHDFSASNIVRIFIIMFMAGVIQYLILYLYIHLGKEHSYQEEKQFLEMNEQFLCRQLELKKEAEEEASRFRHDIRRHCRVMEEYIQNGEMEELLRYVKQYSREMEKKEEEPICQNKAVNSLLSVYGRYARNERICVTMDVSIEDNLMIRDIDLLVILANIFENAIHGCLCSKELEREIDVYIAQKGHKIVIRCRNTCTAQLHTCKGVPDMDTDEGAVISGIMKTVSRYEGESDFTMKNGMFVARVLLNLPV